MLRRTTRSHLIQITQVTPVRPRWASGVRAALGTVIPIIVGSFLHWKAAPVWMGLAGFNVALSDKGGALRTRFAAMAESTFWSALAATAAAFCGANEYAAVAGDVEAAEQAIGDARVTLAQMRRGIQGESPRGEKLLVLLETADRALATEHDPLNAPILNAIADALESERNVVLPRMHASSLA